MDLMYSRYAAPMELIGIYIEQGQFGEFVAEILDMDYKRRLEELEEKENEKLWIPYLINTVINGSKESFLQWKKRLLEEAIQSKGTDEEMTADKIESILKDVFRR